MLDQHHIAPLLILIGEMKPSAMTTCSSLSIGTIGQKLYPLNKGNPCHFRGPLSCSTYSSCPGMRRTCLKSTHAIKSVPGSQGPTVPRWNRLWCYYESSTRPDAGWSRYVPSLGCPLRLPIRLNIDLKHRRFHRLRGRSGVFLSSVAVPVQADF